MARIKTTLIIMVILLLPTLVFATDYTVTQSGAGANFDASGFNSLTGYYPNDTFYFSGTFTTRITVRISGAASGAVTLDGYQAGDCDPLNATCSSSALLNQGLEYDPQYNTLSYVTTQDFRFTMTGSGCTTCVASNFNYSNMNHFIFRRNLVYDTAGGGFYLGNYPGQPTRSEYIIVEDNKFIDHHMRCTVDETSLFALSRWDHVYIKGNVFGHDNPGTPSCPSGCNNATIFGTDDLLFENNEVYGAPGQAGWSVKELSTSDGHQDRHIYRYSKFYDNSRSDQAEGLAFGGGIVDKVSNMYVYASFFYNNLMGIWPHREANDIYIWSNVFSYNGENGIGVWEQSPWIPNNVNVINNTFGYNGRWGFYYTEVHKTGVSFYGGSGHLAKNNLFYNNRAGDGGLYHQIYDSQSSQLEHNTLFHSITTPTWYYAGGNRTLATMQSTYGRENDPPAGEAWNVSTKPTGLYLSNPDGIDGTLGTADDDYTLTANTNTDGYDFGSGCYTNAVDLSGGDSWMETQTGYGRYISPCLDDALDPDNTDFTTTPPTVATVKRSVYGWERGAYAYLTGDTSPPSLSSGSIDVTGTTLSLVFDEAVSRGSGYSDSDFDVDCTVGGDNIGVTYASGDDTATLTWTLDVVVTTTETCNVDFDGSANSIEDSSGNDLGTVDSTALTNNSTVVADTTDPVFLSASISVSGMALTINYTEAGTYVEQGAAYNDSHLDIDCTDGGNDIALTYLSGNQTNSHIYTIAQGVTVGDTCNLDFDGTANSLEDAAGNDLAAIVSGAITNNSVLPKGSTNLQGVRLEGFTITQ